MTLQGQHLITNILGRWEDGKQRNKTNKQKNQDRKKQGKAELPQKLKTNQDPGLKHRGHGAGTALYGTTRVLSSELTKDCKPIFQHLTCSFYH